jgi:hypothetical protein
MAACYRFLEQHDQAELLLQKVIERDPAHSQAQALLAAYGSR